MFWKKMKKDFSIQCPSCEWEEDGKKLWQCSCGNKWNTFSTKGVCPKCKTQWEETSCPACHKSHPHSAWYSTEAGLTLLKASQDPILRARKQSLEARLVGYGIHYYRISHLPYLDYSREHFYPEQEAGYRMIILCALSSVVHNLWERAALIDWFKREDIWKKVSPREQEFLLDPTPAEETLIELSWKIESAFTLGWCLQLIPQLPRLDSKNNIAALTVFQQNIPSLGDAVAPFVATLAYRNLGEIYEENLLNELVTTYFRDLLFNGQKDTTRINRMISFERHFALNWLRNFSRDRADKESAGLLWDETDTST